MSDKPESVSGLTRKHWTGIALLWILITLLFLFLYATSRRVVINEIRHHAMGVAIAAAATLDATRLDAIRGPADAETEDYREIQHRLGLVALSNPDVRYIYTMRKAAAPFASQAAFEYVVDQAARDYNRNGKIERDEESEVPGTPYDASHVPEMVRSWTGATADYSITPDPPYPDLISGYAPVVNSDGETKAIVGVDVMASTVARKLLAIRIAVIAVWLMLLALVTLVVHLYYQQRDAFDQIKELNEELESRHLLLREANEKLAMHNEQFQRELRLAQSVQQGFLPRTFPRQDRIVFDTYYLTCAILGGDLYDVFDVDDDKVGLFMADVAGHGVSAALISGLLKMAVSSVRQRQGDASATWYTDLSRPGDVMKALNEVLVAEMPEGEFITLVYAVLDLSNNKLLYANAGHLWPILYSSRTKTHNVTHGKGGLALGIEKNQVYPTNELSVETGDKLILYTDGLTEAMNEHGQEFGSDRLLKLVDENGATPPVELVATIREAVDAHRGASEVSDDFSVLVAEIR